MNKDIAINFFQATLCDRGLGYCRLYVVPSEDTKEWIGRAYANDK